MPVFDIFVLASSLKLHSTSSIPMAAFVQGLAGMHFSQRSSFMSALCGPTDDNS